MNSLICRKRSGVKSTLSPCDLVFFFVLLSWTAWTTELSAQDLLLGEKGQRMAVQLQEIYKQAKKFQGVQATFKSGVLTLRGPVKTQASRLDAERVANKFQFVYIQNELKVDRVLNQKWEKQRASLKDEEIESKLNVIFSKLPALKNVKVEVSQGIVSLSGKVSSELSRKKAESIATSMKEVVFVDNQIADLDDFQEQLAPSIRKIKKFGEKTWTKIPVFIVASLIFVFFLFLSRSVKHFSFGFKSNRLLQSLVQQIIQISVVLVGLFIALDILDATAVVGAILGSAGILGLAVGFAFRDIVENYLTSLLLSVRQPFEQDDFVEINGLQGTIVKLTTSETILMTEEGNHLRFPNSVVFKSTMVNYSRNPLRRFAIQFEVGVVENLLSAQELGLEVLKGLPGILADPVPSSLIVSLGDSSVKIQFMGWVDQQKNSYLRVKGLAIRSIKEKFDRANIDMPYPTQRIEVLALNAKEASEKEKERKKWMQSEVKFADDVSINKELDDQVELDRKMTDGEDLLKS